MLSPNRIPKSNKRRPKTSSDLKRHQMTSNDPVIISETENVAPVKPVKTIKQNERWWKHKDC